MDLDAQRVELLGSVQGDGEQPVKLAIDLDIDDLIASRPLLDHAHSLLHLWVDL